jgi:hypothetical protein
MLGHFQRKLKMTEKEEQRLYRILFEDSAEEVGNEVYELYDTVTEIIQNRAPILPQKQRVLH